MAEPVSARVRKRRAALRAEGLRPVQMWMVDTRRRGFAEECRRQSEVVAQADLEDRDLLAAMDRALEDVDGWTP